MRSTKTGILFIIFGLVKEKVLMCKCPNHEFQKENIIINFYARLPRHDKDLLDASSRGSFMNQMIDDKWNLIEKSNVILKIERMTKVKS